MKKNSTPNALVNEKSPYLLQHAYNPVQWYPWGEQAFAKAKAEDKPVFLSIGYSTCHWCHVMERESFEDERLARLLNEHFVSIKVDKEERPDIDSIYMRVCQALTGSGGWPTSIFMTPDQKPFFAGTYYPPHAFAGLLEKIAHHWSEDKQPLLENSEEIIKALQREEYTAPGLDENLPLSAYEGFNHGFDAHFGGFGKAPKFPTPHNLLFLMGYARHKNEPHALEMAEKTLQQMYKGGIFDHIGYGFSRYSTDRYWLAPHFEKMLYDNALLAVAYLSAYAQTDNALYKSVAEKIFIYIAREMTSEDGGFYSAQDADSEGVEGKYYIFSQQEVAEVLGKAEGERFCAHYDITPRGNFEGKSIPNLIKQQADAPTLDELLPPLYEFRKSRTSLHKDHKMLTAWNALMLWAYAVGYRVLGDNSYLQAAEKACKFIETQLAEEDTLYVGTTEGKRSGKGFLDDYAFYILALIELYEATFNECYLQRAMELCTKTLESFFDTRNGGFYFYGSDNEPLVLRPKECYDGAMPSGNSVMAYNLDRLAKLTKEERLRNAADQQREYMLAQAEDHPPGYSFFLLSTLPTTDIVCVLKEESELANLQFHLDDVVRVLHGPTKEYPLQGDQTTFYVCRGNQCLPPTNQLP